MKKLLILTTLISITFAYEAEVKKADVTLIVNAKEVSHKVGDKFSLNGNDIVCFEEGKGRVVITAKDYKKQLSRHSKGCKKLPQTDKKKKSSASLTSIAKMTFSKAKEETVSGVSRKSATQDELNATITLDDKKYIIIENSEWGPLPVVLTVFDKKEEVLKIENEEDLVSSFVLKSNTLKVGYKVVVTNAFDEVLATVEVK